MGIVSLAKDVRPGDTVHVRRGDSFPLEARTVERVEILAHTVRFWFGGHATAVMHPYEVLGVERAD